MIAASSNLRSRIRLAAVRKVATRSRHGRCAQSRCTAFAAATARATCSGVAVANRPSIMLVSIGEASTIGGPPDGTASRPMYSG